MKSLAQLKEEAVVIKNQLARLDQNQRLRELARGKIGDYHRTKFRARLKELERNIPVHQQQAQALEDRAQGSLNAFSAHIGSLVNLTPHAQRLNRSKAQLLHVVDQLAPTWEAIQQRKRESESDDFQRETELVNQRRELAAKMRLEDEKLQQKILTKKKKLLEARALERKEHQAWDEHAQRVKEEEASTLITPEFGATFVTPARQHDFSQPSRPAALPPAPLDIGAHSVVDPPRRLPVATSSSMRPQPAAAPAQVIDTRAVSTRPTSVGRHSRDEPGRVDSTGSMGRGRGVGGRTHRQNPVPHKQNPMAFAAAQPERKQREEKVASATGDISQSDVQAASRVDSAQPPRQRDNRDVGNVVPVGRVHAQPTPTKVVEAKTAKPVSAAHQDTQLLPAPAQQSPSPEDSARVAAGASAQPGVVAAQMPSASSVSTSPESDKGPTSTGHGGYQLPAKRSTRRNIISNIGTRDFTNDDSDDSDDNAIPIASLATKSASATLQGNSDDEDEFDF